MTGVQTCALPICTSSSSGSTDGTSSSNGSTDGTSSGSSNSIGAIPVYVVDIR